MASGSHDGAPRRYFLAPTVSSTSRLPYRARVVPPLKIIKTEKESSSSRIFAMQNGKFKPPPPKPNPLLLQEEVVEGMPTISISHSPSQSTSPNQIHQHLSTDVEELESTLGFSGRTVDTASSGNVPCEPNVEQSDIDVLRNKIHSTPRGVTVAQFKDCVKQGKLSHEILIGIGQMSRGEIKLLLKGIDHSLIMKIIDRFPPCSDSPAKDSLIILASIVDSIRIERMEEKESASLDTLDAVSLRHLKDVGREEFIINLNELMLVDPIEIVIRCYQIFGKSNSKSFLRDYLKHVLKHLLLPSQYKCVYVSNNHKPADGGFILPSGILDTLKRISHRLFSIHVLDDESKLPNRLLKRINHDRVFMKVIGRVAVTFRKGQLKGVIWLPNCVADSNGIFVQEEPMEINEHDVVREEEELEEMSTNRSE